ncbi:MAG: hypothetical protein IJS53_01725 [Clostridia bacterium]|nr:hypothetical protein [Clostridia bacterium]
MNARFFTEEWLLRQQGYDAAAAPLGAALFMLRAGSLTLPGRAEEDMDLPPADACDWLFTRLCVNGHHVKPALAQEYACELDLKTARVTREYAVTQPEGGAVRVRFERALSLKRAGFAAQRVTVTSERDALLSLVLGADGSALPDAWRQTGSASDGNAASLALQGPDGTEQAFLFRVDAPAPPMAMAIDRRSVLCVADGLRAGAPYTVERRVLCAKAPCSPDALDDAPSLDAIVMENAGILAAFWQRFDALPPDAGPLRLALLQQFMNE